MNARMNPWAGLSAYQDGDPRQFCGRDNESFDVAHLIDNNIFVTLYGKSGIGKSSLLNAGVFPRLRAMGYLPVPVRLGIEARERSLQECICSKIAEVVARAGRMEESEVVTLPDDETDETWLWSYFARNTFLDGEGKVLFPVLVFDQFEEILRTRHRDAGALLRQIRYMKDETHALPDKADYHYDFNFRFLVSIREDELYRLEDCIDALYLADMKSCRYRLCGLSEKGALEVVTIPGADCLEASSAPEIAARMVDIARNKEDGSISTNILSLICSRTFDEMLRRNAPAIDLPLVESVVTENPFEKYYLEAVAGLPRKARVYIEDHLVDGDERRNSVPEGDFIKAVPGGDVLVQDGPRKILQRISVATGSNQTRIELVHDSFCAPLTNFRKKRQRSRRSWLAIGFALVALLIAVVSFSIIHTLRQREQALQERQWKMLENQSRYIAETAIRLTDEGDALLAKRLIAAVLPEDVNHPTDRPLVPRAVEVFWHVNSIGGGVLRGHTAPVNSVAFTPDGKRIISGSNDHTIRIWDSESGALIHVLEGHDGIVETVAVSPDGEIIVSGGLDNENNIRLWESSTGKLIRTMDFPGMIESVAFSPDGKWIIANAFRISNQKAVMIWDAGTGELLEQFEHFHYSHITADGNKMILANTEFGLFVIIDLETGTYREIDSLDDYFGYENVVFSPDGKWAVYVNTYGGLSSVIDIETGKDSFMIECGYTGAVAFSSDSKFLVSESRESGGIIYIWEIETGSLIRQLERLRHNYVLSFAISPDVKRVVSGMSDNTIQVWDLEDEDTCPYHVLTDSIPFPDYSRSLCLTFGSDGRRLYSVDYDYYSGYICAWDSETGHLLGQNRLDGLFWKVSLSPNGKRLAGVNGVEPTQIQVRDCVSGQILRYLKGEVNEITALAYSIDGQKIVSGSWESIAIWDEATGDRIRYFDDRHFLTESIAFSPDEKHIAVGTRDGNVLILDSKSGQLVNTLESSSSSVTSVSFSPDGKHLVSSYRDAIVRVWDIQTGNIMSIIEDPVFEGSVVSFSPDSKEIVIGNDYDVNIYIWDYSLEDKLKAVRAKYPPLTPEERKEYYLE